MRGEEFIEKVRRIGRDRKVEVRFDQKRGKGSHGTLYYGDRRTIVKDRKKDIGPGLLAKMISQLRLTNQDFR